MAAATPEPREIEPGIVRRAEPWLGREIASRAAVEFVFTGGEDRHPSRILRTRSKPIQQLGELYDEMLERSSLAGLWLKRCRAVMALPRTIEPANSSPEALAAADLCRAALAEVPQFDGSLEALLSGISHGVSISEIVWQQPSGGVLAGMWVPAEILDRPLCRFGFKCGALHVRSRERAELVAVPPLKFLVARHGTKDSPWGRALLDRAYWAWFVLGHVEKFWAVFIEKWAQPTTLGKFKHSPDDKVEKARRDALLSALQAIQMDYAVVIPEDLDASLLEATRSGSASYETFIASLERRLSLLFLGEVDTSGMGKGPGSFAKSQTSNTVRLEVVKGDAHWLGSVVSDTLLRWITGINLGPLAPPPKLVIDTLEAEDRELRQEGIAKTLAAGLPVSRAFFYRTHQVPVPRPGEELVSPPAATSASVAPPPADAAALEARRRTVRLAAEDETADLVREAGERSRDMDDVVALYSPELMSYWAAQQQLALEWAERDQPAAALIERVAPVSQIAGQQLQTAILHAHGLAMLSVQGELGRAVRLEAASWRDARSPASAVAFWERLLAIGNDLFKRLSDLARRQAFSVVALEDSRLLQQILELAKRTDTGGGGRREFREGLARLYETNGLTPTSDWHADLILQNNVRQAHASQLWAQTVGNPAAHRLIPYLSYWTLDDAKVREREQHNHRVMHGATFAISHPIWETWWYPAGHGCRCGIATINRRRAERMGLLGAEPLGPWPVDPITGERALPDPGFRNAPRRAPDAAVDAETRLREEIDRTRNRNPGFSPLLELFLMLINLVLAPSGDLL